MANKLIKKSVAAAIACISTTVLASITYTTDADFNLGILNSLTFDTETNQLQLSATGSTFPILWAANAGEDSVSKIDTDNDCETGRYATWFFTGNHSAWSGPAPSRTAVDTEGNVFVANRQFPSTRQMNVLKILTDGGVDRNGNGVIDTSMDVNGDCVIDRNDPAEFLAPVDDNGDGILQTSEIRDERVVWISHVGPGNGLGRSLCIGTDGNIWLGDFNNRAYYKLDATDGSVLADPSVIPTLATPGHSSYGCLIDRDGILFSASLGSAAGVLDTNTNTFLGVLALPRGSYGIAIGNDKVYYSGGSSFLEWDPDAGAADTNPLTGLFSSPADATNGTLGISVDGDGNIILGQSPIRKYNASGTTQWATFNAGASDTRGVVPDSNNNVWAVNRASNNATKFDSTTGNQLATVPLGNQPYTYSDATGFAATNVTDPTGVWTVIADGGVPDEDWDSIFWNTEPEGHIPPNGSITVEARSANSIPSLGLEAYTPVVNGADGLPLAGQFIQLRATLRPGDDDESPVLSDITVNEFVEPPATSCDANGDQQIDILDIRIISSHRNVPVPPADPMLDINGDGFVNVGDGRACVLQCTNARCAP